MIDDQLSESGVLARNVVFGPRFELKRNDQIEPVIVIVPDSPSARRLALLRRPTGNPQKDFGWVIAFC